MIAQLAVIALAQEDLGPDELEVQRQPLPRYPDAAKVLELPDQACTATVSMDADGVPFDVTVADCDPAFHQATREALLRWRWRPLGVQARTTIRVWYRLADVPSEPLFVGDYVELFGGLGVLHAPDDPTEPGPAPTAGLFRVWVAGGLDRIRAPRLTVAGELDARGFATFAGYGRVMAGGNAIAGPVRGTLTAGIGLTQREVLTPEVTWFVPVGASLVLTPTGDDFAVNARGGVDVAPADGSLSPGVVVGVTFGGAEPQGVFGLRLEGGWRRELGADTITAAFGFGI